MLFLSNHSVNSQILPFSYSSCSYTNIAEEFEIAACNKSPRFNCHYRPHPAEEKSRLNTITTFTTHNFKVTVVFQPTHQVTEWVYFQVISNPGQMSMRVAEKNFIAQTQTQAIKTAHSSIVYYPKHLEVFIKSTVLGLYTFFSPKGIKGSLERRTQYAKV